jgi:hypothetical protein
MSLAAQSLVVFGDESTKLADPKKPIKQLDNKTDRVIKLKA